MKLFSYMHRKSVSCIVKGGLFSVVHFDAETETVTAALTVNRLHTGNEPTTSSTKGKLNGSVFTEQNTTHS